MQKLFLFCLLCFACLMPTSAAAYGHYTVFSGVLADVYVDNEYSATISATQTLKLILSGPKSYVIGVRDQATGRTYKESVDVGTNLNEHREIHAFSVVPTSKAEVTIFSQLPAELFVDNVLNSALDYKNPLTIYLSGPKTYVFEIRATNSKLVYREDVVIEQSSGLKHEIRAFSEYPATVPLPVETEVPVVVAEGSVTREEMNAAINDATAKAKAEALSEEAGRRQRAEKRDVTNKGIAHVVGVEANGGLSSSVKNMERIKLLFEAIPSLKK